MDFKIETTAQEARARLEQEFAAAPDTHKATVASEIDLIMDCVDHGTTLIYSEYLNLEVVIVEDDAPRLRIGVSW